MAVAPPPGRTTDLTAELAAWLAAHRPPPAPTEAPLSALGAFRDDAESIATARSWQRRLADAGLAAITWPVDRGGRGAGMREALAVADTLARYDLRLDVFTIGVGMVGPTLITHGSGEQQRRFLTPMRRGDEIWCQLWSEPGAGSDLASLASRARRQ